MITQERLKELFTYEDGNLIRNSSRGCAKKGTIAGSINDRGYLVIRIDKVPYKAHRLVWLYHYGVVPDQLDHKDRDKTNNRLSNLREANHTQQNANKSLRKDSNGTMGVYQQGNRWRAYIGVDGNRIYLGSFRTKEEASTIYQATAKEWFGEFYNSSSL